MSYYMRTIKQVKVDKKGLDYEKSRPNSIYPA